MAVPTSKVELLDAMTTGFARLEAELASIRPEDATSSDMEGHARGTAMSVNDLLAYLTGWGQLVLKWVRLRNEGLEPDFPETGFKWNQLGQLAQKFYRDQSGLDFPTRVERLRATHAQLVALVAGLDDAALYGHGWYEKWTLGRMIQFNTASPYANARARIRKWKKTRAEA
ncbi:ClbS/DfsB family four-helix bundle protein [Rhizobium sp. CAU 1783]